MHWRTIGAFLDDMPRDLDIVVKRLIARVVHERRRLLRARTVGAPDAQRGSGVPSDAAAARLVAPTWHGPAPADQRPR